MRFRGVLFDLDGTLLNTLDDLADSMNAVLSARGLPAHPVDAYRHFVGEGASLLVTRALPEEMRDENTVAAVQAEFLDIYAAGWKVKTRPYDGVPQLLAELAARGVPMAVLSNKPDEATRDCIGHFFPRVPFAAVRGQVPGMPRKPDPAGALLIAKEMHLDPAKILYAGDSSTDMRCAVAAGMFPLGVLWGFRSREELLAHGARALATRPEEIAEFASTG
jgi:phosphoglycolate phosphatase